MTPSRTLTTLAVLCMLVAGAILVAVGCGGGGGGSSVTSPTPPDTSGAPPDTTAPPPQPPRFNFAYPGTGVSNSFTFGAEGDWGYFCLKHGTEGMTGTVFVRATSLRDSAYVQVGAPPTDKRFAPDTVTVKVGGKVRWVNVSGDPDHTTTRL